MALTEHSSELHTLLDKLDDLWEQHLNLVDVYQEAQTALAKHLSKGHFSLAQANFRSPGRGRYGKDYYDERMKPSRVARIKESKDGRLELSVHETKIRTKTVPSATIALEKLSLGASAQLPTPSNSPEPEAEKPEAESGDHDEPDETTKDDTVPEAQSTPRDPLHWFGILVPQELRAAQSSFSTATDGPVIDAVNASRRLRESEVEIGRTRKSIKKAEKATTGLREQSAQVV
ncbi:hypothetical protein LTR78_005743 [Recurvomyces mirabilis]|uniref:Vacuolar ATPase assembly protein VMA22 n=1 Tax=Recurvomyces mirabilis TaxID=574656 RepID=A0AAE1C0W2_9PEZI|nr:hypothetical protein LTR78_005743 [Recurvomyces mirabilis]KAK5154122.1 hypothetical protein LTS14_006807 [Recurvomyces mirabilis]